MTILSVTEKFYNLFWNDMGWPGGLLIIGIALAVTGSAILSNYRMDGIFGLVPLICGIFLVGALVFIGKQEKYQIPIEVKTKAPRFEIFKSLSKAVSPSPNSVVKISIREVTALRPIVTYDNIVPVATKLSAQSF